MLPISPSQRHFSYVLREGHYYYSICDPEHEFVAQQTGSVLQISDLYHAREIDLRWKQLR